MKLNLHIYVAWALLMAAAWPAGAVPVETNAPAHSIFNLPSNPNEGRDPFFPNSMRPYEQSMARATRHMDVTSLQIKGFSEIAGRRCVIINNHTFSEGDEGDVITSGGRIHLHCLTVGTDSVLVETSGARHLLKFTGQ